MAKKNRALVSQEAQALIQEVMSNSLVTHHFHRCPEFQKQFLEHLKGCPVHREEMDALRSRAKEWAVDMRRKLFGLYAIRGPKVDHSVGKQLSPKEKSRLETASCSFALPEWTTY